MLYVTWAGRGAGKGKCQGEAPSLPLVIIPLLPPLPSLPRRAPTLLGNPTPARSCHLPPPPAPATCPRHLPPPPAPASCSWFFPLPPAPATCPRHLPLPPAPASCSWFLPLPLIRCPHRAPLQHVDWDKVVLSDGSSIPCGVCVWSTGIAPRWVAVLSRGRGAGKSLGGVGSLGQRPCDLLVGPRLAWSSTRAVCVSRRMHLQLLLPSP